MTDELPDHIEEYLKTNITDEKFLDLFESDTDNINLRTDLTFNEVVSASKIKAVSDFINSKFKYTHINFKLYDDFLILFMRNKVSLDRKSRGEFVDINRKERFEQNLRRFGDFSNLAKTKE